VPETGMLRARYGSTNNIPSAQPRNDGKPFIKMM
jgi:hypothetical protein